MAKMRALLLLGPTGSGKSPLGDRLEARGLWSVRCAHFDFGANLRAEAADFGNIKAGDADPGEFTSAERAAILNSLATGALLERGDFPIAAKILARFAAEKQLSQGDLLVLNGLPRHTGQARDLERYVDMAAVVSLECTASVIRERMRLNTGGDRAGRADDHPEAVESRLRIFAERTLPLLEYYRSRYVPVFPIAVGVATQPEDIILTLEGLKPRISPSA